MRVSRTLVGLLLALGLIVGACGGGDTDDLDTVEDAAGANSDSSDGGEPDIGGSGTITWGDQTYEFDSVLCGGNAAGYVINGSAGPVSLSVSGEDPDDPQVVVSEELDPFYARPKRGDGDFSFDGSKAKGNMEFEGPTGDVRQGSFDLTCD